MSELINSIQQNKTPIEAFSSVDSKETVSAKKSVKVLKKGSSNRRFKSPRRFSTAVQRRRWIKQKQRNYAVKEK